MKIKGRVISGKNRGEKIGFPTVNLSLSEKDAEHAQSGVYAGKIFLADGEKKVAIFIDSEKHLLEAYILDFSGNLRGKNVEIEVGEKTREIAEFPEEKDLVAQIGRDVEKIRNME